MLNSKTEFRISKHEMIRYIARNRAELDEQLGYQVDQTQIHHLVSDSAKYLTLLEGITIHGTGLGWEITVKSPENAIDVTKHIWNLANIVDIFVTKLSEPFPADTENGPSPDDIPWYITTDGITDQHISRAETYMTAVKQNSDPDENIEDHAGIYASTVLEILCLASNLNPKGNTMHDENGNTVPRYFLAHSDGTDEILGSFLVKGKTKIELFHDLITDTDELEETIEYLSELDGKPYNMTTDADKIIDHILGCYNFLELDPVYARIGDFSRYEQMANAFDKFCNLEHSKMEFSTWQGIIDIIEHSFITGTNIEW